MDLYPLKLEVESRLERWVEEQASLAYRCIPNCPANTIELNSVSIATDELDSKSIDADHEVEVGLANTTETFFFTVSNLKTRGCKGLLELIKQKDGTPIILGADATSKAHGIYTNASSKPAMKLFEEWVDTGRLRPVEKNCSGAIIDYYILYMIAYHLGHRNLCIAALNETRAWTRETGYAPSLHLTRELRRVFGESMPVQLTQALAFCRGAVCLYYEGTL